MKKHLCILAFILPVILLTTSGCKKDSPASCATITVTGTVVNSNGTDGSITATATGGTGFTYNINGGTFQASGTFTALAPGTYTIIAKNSAGCTQSQVFTVAGTKTYFLTKATWKFSTATVGGTDVSAFLQACQKDNTLTFVAAGTGILDEGPTKCNAGDPQTTPYTWNFASSETILHISAVLFTGGNNDFTLVTLSATQLIGSQVITVGGMPQTAVVTFIH